LTKLPEIYTKMRKAAIDKSHTTPSSG